MKLPYKRVNWKEMDTEGLPAEITALKEAVYQFHKTAPLDDDGYNSIRNDMLYSLAVDGIEILTGEHGSEIMKLTYLLSNSSLCIKDIDEP
jgi:hypothetical protein